MIPQDAFDLHLPSDLSGITYDTYDTKRRDREWQQATAPFCAKVRRKIESSGFRRKKQHERLDNLAIAYACCQWIPDKEPYGGIERWRRKDQIFDEMIEECRREPPNKELLATQNLRVISDLALDYIANNMRVFASIEARPEGSDVDLILAIRLIDLPDGNARSEPYMLRRRSRTHFRPNPKSSG